MTWRQGDLCPWVIPERSANVHRRVLANRASGGRVASIENISDGKHILLLHAVGCAKEGIKMMQTKRLCTFDDMFALLAQYEEKTGMVHWYEGE